DLLPTLWFRNIWTWQSYIARPSLSQYKPAFAFPTRSVVEVKPCNDLEDPRVATGSFIGKLWLYCEGTPPLLFTENETNNERLYGVPNASPYVKDSINEYIVHGKGDAVNPALTGTKVSAHYHLMLAGGGTKQIHLRLSNFAPEDI